LGFGFQDAARYHIDARRTWLATSILPIATLALGSQPRQRELQGCEPRGSLRVKSRRSLGVKPKGSPGVKAKGSSRVTSHTPGSARKC